MRDHKVKLPKSSMKLQAGHRPARAEQAYRSQPDSASQLADQFCDEMIKNLRRNVSEQKRRSTEPWA